MSQVINATKLRSKSGILATTRAGEWWVHKFSPLLATFYATVGLLGGSLLPLLGRLLGLVGALLVGAIYVSVVNDWTDLAADAAAGKANRLAGRSGRFIGLALGGCLLAGSAFGMYFWHLSHLVAGLYLAAWVVYSLYSLPPVRLKNRGLPGVLADASGAHLLPQLLVVAAVQAWLGRAVPGAWWVAVGAWALACGIRNIVWHQLGDAAADAQAGIDTLVLRWGAGRTQWLGQAVVFPVEVVAFGMVLGLGQPGWALGLLGLYGGLEWCRWRIWGYRPVVLAPDRRIVLNDYYLFFYPLAFLLPQCLRYPADGLVLLLHGALFGPAGWPLVQEVGGYLQVLTRRMRA
jgi:4-hydroxybenzoate polyprenyltransferase